LNTKGLDFLEKGVLDLVKDFSDAHTEVQQHAEELKQKKLDFKLLQRNTLKDLEGKVWSMIKLFVFIATRRVKENL
jgi:hypothetical protein